jgi:hypothetical protein
VRLTSRDNNRTDGLFRQVAVQIPALDWLDRAYDSHDVHLVLISVDPKWDTFRSDDRFLA